MSDFNLERVTIVLVEDNAFVRRTLEDLLRHFGAARISSFADGEEAISYLKDLKRVKNPGPDIIISDLIMSPINGQLLLRWVRTSKDSPNRFVPFMMVSGAADREFVAAVRDLGANEFLAKPFSAKSLFARLAAIIDHPRRVIATKDYFGPDRRRMKNAGPPGTEERRRQGEDHITFVYSADKTVHAKSASDVWCFNLPNTLKDKVTGGRPGPVVMPDDVLAQAEEGLQRAALDFATWAQDYLTNIAELVADAEAHPDQRARCFTEINMQAHELRGQGGTFGYPLISVFGKMLYEATQGNVPETDAQVGIVAAHVDAMRAVIRGRISGNGGEVGQQVLASLQAAIARHKGSA